MLIVILSFPHEGNVVYKYIAGSDAAWKEED